MNARPFSDEAKSILGRNPVGPGRQVARVIGRKSAYPCEEIRRGTLNSRLL